MNPFLIILAASLVMIIYAYTKRADTKDVRVWFVRFVHYYAGIFMLTYVFLFDSRYDTIMLGFLTLVVAHWLTLHQCFLTMIEKQLLYGDYKTVPTWSAPFIDILFDDKLQKVFLSVRFLLWCLLFGTLLYRLYKKG